MFKSILVMGLSFIMSILLYPKFIKYLQQNEAKQKASEYALEEYKEKANTVTFGGLIFVMVPIFITLIFTGLKSSPMALLAMLVYFSYAIIGFIDDYKIIKEGKNDGLSPRRKFLLQLLMAFVFYRLYIVFGGNNYLNLPFLKQPLDLSWCYMLLMLFLLTGTSNAVNLTDGMDGLASGTMIIALLPFIIFLYRSHEFDLLMLVMAVIGSLFAFLFFNRKPAQIFMGDVGSLALGSLLAILAIITSKELLLALIGGVFVFETLTVIIQRISWKTRKKRVFKYTPIHYSFILSGWKEKDVVLFFYALGLTFMVIALGLSAIL